MPAKRPAPPTVADRQAEGVLPPEFGGKRAFDAMRTAPLTRFIMFARSPPKSTAINSQTNTLASG